MPNRKLVVIASALIAGCAPMFVWQHPTKNEAAYAQDRRECDYDAAKATANIRSGLEAGFQKAELRDMCLEARGYKRVRQTQ